MYETYKQVYESKLTRVGKKGLREMNKQKVFVALIALFGSSGALAIQPGLEGESVQNIEASNGISGWEHIDNQRVLVNVDEKSTYLLTLKHQCHGLAWAQNVTVSMSNNTIWAGFDSIRADGLACPIDRIEKIDPRDLLQVPNLQ